MNDNRIEYLYQSIADTQSAIRAVDTKAGFLFVIICLPLAKLYSIISIMKFLYFHSEFVWLLIPFSCLTWLVGLISIFLSVVAVSNPKKHIKGDHPNGTFYGGQIFTVKPFNFFRNNIISNMSTDEFVQIIPAKNERLIKELSFEKMKLAYVRDIKFMLINIAILSTVLWMVSGILIWTFQILMVSCHAN